VCEFVNTVTGRALVTGEVCSSANTQCRAVCDCREGRLGDDCSLDQEEFDLLKSLRDLLCLNVLHSMELQTVDSASDVSARANLIHKAFQDASQISTEALLHCSAALVTTVSRNLPSPLESSTMPPSLTCSATSSEFLLNSLSSVLELGRAIPSPTVNSISTAISDLSRICQQSMAAEEKPILTDTKNMRMLTSVSSGENLDDSVSPTRRLARHLQTSPTTPSTASDGTPLPTTCQSTVTTTEEIVGQAAPVLCFGMRELDTRRRTRTSILPGTQSEGWTGARLGAVAGATVGVVHRRLASSRLQQLTAGFTIVQLNSNPKGDTHSSEYRTVSLETVVYGPYLNSSLQDVDEDTVALHVSVQLPNDVPVAYPSILSSNTTVKCATREAYDYFHTISCPNGRTYNSTCPAGFRGVLTVTCPGYENRPQCTVYNESIASFYPDPQCEVISFSADSTTCFCRHTLSLLQYLQQGRRKLVGEDRGVLATITQEFSVRQITVAYDYSQEFLKFAESDVQESNVIRSFLYSILGLLVLGVGLISYPRKTDKYMKTLTLQLNRLDPTAPGDGEGGQEGVTLAQGSGVYHGGQESSADRAKVDRRRPAHNRTIRQFFQSLVPVEYRDAPWYALYATELQQHHSVVSVLSLTLNPSPSSVHHKDESCSEEMKSAEPELLVQWIALITRLLCIAMADTVAIRLLYPDDGSTCEVLKTKESCTGGAGGTVETFLDGHTACEWDAPNELCKFEGEKLMTMLYVLVLVLMVIG
jgi:hypothetical protein